jgi:hypothetical protein
LGREAPCLQLDMLVDDSKNEQEPGAAQEVEEDLLRVRAELHGEALCTGASGNRVAGELFLCDYVPQIVQLLVACLGPRGALIHKPLLMPRHQLQPLSARIQINQLQVALDEYGI